MIAETENLSDSDFNRISQLISTVAGIKLPPQKKSMVQARLRRRMKTLQIYNYKDYCQYLFNSENADTEIPELIDVISTNKTDFFREIKHFDYLTNSVLPRFIDAGSGDISIWSAGSSTGEEAYSIAFNVEEFNANSTKKIRYNILGTDISSIAVKTANTGIYNASKTHNIPEKLKKKYLLKSKSPEKNLVRIAPEIRKKVNFLRLNLNNDKYSIHSDFDIVFCRNTLIYFSPQTQKSIVKKLIDHLKPMGYLFIGHSESLFHLNLDLKALRPTIYQKP